MADEVKKINVVSSSTAQASEAVTKATIDEQFSGVKQELFARFELLPDDIKKAITDDAYQQKLFTIAKEQKMTYEELGMMETETTMVLLGMTKPEDFRDELQLELKKNDAEIDLLVGKINEQVFAPIRASLERVYAAKKEPVDYLQKPLEQENIKSQEQNTFTSPQPSPKLGEGVVQTQPVAVAPNTTPRVIPPTTPTPATIQSAFAKSGVVLTETPKPVAPIQTSQMPNRSDILKGIENPPKIPSLGMVADKLNSTGVIMPTKTTDYSVLKSTPPANLPTTPASPAKNDPYREPIG